MANTVKEIVKKYLEENGFSGLCNLDCGCELKDLMCCKNEFISNCKIGQKHYCENCDSDIKENCEIDNSDWCIKEVEKG